MNIIFLIKMGLIGIWIGIVTFIGYLCVPFYWRNGILFARWFRYISWGVRAVGGFSVNMENSNIVSDSVPCIFMANHQHNIDVITYGKYIPDGCVTIGKREILFFPVFGQFYWMSGGILLDRKDRKRAIGQLNKTLKQVKQHKMSVAFMPEGTRNKHPDTMLPFKKGPFHFAIQSGLPIVPLVCEPLEQFLKDSKSKWNLGEIRMGALKPIETKGLTEDDIPALMEQVRSVMSAEYNRLKNRAK